MKVKRNSRNVRNRSVNRAFTVASAVSRACIFEMVSSKRCTLDCSMALSGSSGWGVEKVEAEAEEEEDLATAGKSVVWVVEGSRTVSADMLLDRLFLAWFLLWPLSSTVSKVGRGPTLGIMVTVEDFLEEAGLEASEAPM